MRIVVNSPQPFSKPGLAGREARLFDGNNPVIVKNQPMDQVDLARSLPQSAPVF